MVIKQVEFITLKSKDTWYMQKKKNTRKLPKCPLLQDNSDK